LEYWASFARFDLRKARGDLPVIVDRRTSGILPSAHLRTFANAARAPGGTQGEMQAPVPALPTPRQDGRLQCSNKPPPVVKAAASGCRAKREADL
jgi:hypothetical protein